MADCHKQQEGEKQSEIGVKGKDIHEGRLSRVKPSTSGKFHREPVCSQAVVHEEFTLLSGTRVI